MRGLWRTSELAGAKEFSSKSFDRHVRANFADETRKITSTNLAAAYASFLRRHAGLGGWYSSLLECSDVHVRWEDRRPTIALSGTSDWLRLCNEFEPDVLLTFHLAWKRIGGNTPSETIAALDAWPTIPRVTDHEMEKLFSAGISDMHVHAGGVRIPQAAWLDLIRSPRALASFKSLRDCYRDIGRDVEADLDAARKARANLAKFAFGRAEEPVQHRPTRENWWSWSAKNLSRERELILHGWHALLHDPDVEEDLARNFDRYIEHKNRFFARAREPAFNAVRGLQYFTDRYYRAIVRVPARNRWKPPPIRATPAKPAGDAQSRLGWGGRGPRILSSYGTSKRLEMSGIGDACRYLAESSGLVRAELRLPPFDHAADYRRFFSRWKVLKQRIDEELEGTQHTPKHMPMSIRFAVHFKRTRGPASATRSHTKSIIAELDRHSAALRAVLACRRPDDGLEALQRIDVAGNERDTPLAAFAWHFRLLRDDPDTVQAFEKGQVPPPWRSHLSGWTRLEQRGLHKGTPALRRLGVTVHAGEEFEDVLEGAYQIAAALDLIQLSAGDGIGHGLVLAAETEPFESEHRFATMPGGEYLDQLCWLRYAAKEFVPAADQVVQNARIDAAIMRAVGALYEPNLARRLSASDLVWLWKTKAGFCPRWIEECQGDATKQELLWLEDDETFCIKRDTFEPLETRKDLGDIAQAARKWLLKRVSESGVVVELNPSSNLRISGAEAVSVNPTVVLVEAMAKGLLACVNTDNPGVFVSCIENEYALILDGLRKRNANVDSVRKLMEVARRVGVEFLR